MRKFHVAHGCVHTGLSQRIFKPHLWGKAFKTKHLFSWWLLRSQKFADSLLQCHYLLHMKTFYMIVMFWTVILCLSSAAQVKEEQEFICSDITYLWLCLHHARKFPQMPTLLCTQCTAHTAKMVFTTSGAGVHLKCHFNLGGTGRGATQGAPLQQWSKCCKLHIQAQGHPGRPRILAGTWPHTPTY